MSKTLIQSLLDNDFHHIKSNIMKVVDNKVREKIEAKKDDVLEKINSSK
jgi:hypothetical protein